MKGIVFTEFLEMVESTFGLHVVDTIIENSNLPSSGAYTSVGTYDFNEMVALLTELSKETNIPANDLLYSFGHYLFTGLAEAHPEVVSSYKTPLALLCCIEDHIHIHVKNRTTAAGCPTRRRRQKSNNTN